MNQLSTIAEAVKATLANATFTTLTPDLVSRVYVPAYGETETHLILFVLGLEEKPDLFGDNTTRGSSEHDYTIKVAIYKRVDAGDRTSEDAVTEFDALSDFRQQVIDVLKSNRTQGDSTLQDLANAPVYDPSQLEKEGVFVSVITLVYRLLR